MTRRSARYQRICPAIWLGLVLAGVRCGQASGEPLDACALSPAKGGFAAPQPELTKVTRVTGPNSVQTADGREIRLSSVTTPHRFAPGPTAVEQPTAPADSEGIDQEEPSDTAASETTPPTDPIAAARSALNAWLVGAEIRLYPVTPLPDRYGRMRAAIERVSDGLWIEAELVAQGLARVQPQTDDFGCARHLEALEAAARAAKRGLWSLPEFAVIDAGDATRDRWIGHYVLIEGTVVSLGTSGTRRYLNFGRNFSRDFAIVLVDKGKTTMQSKEKRSPSRFQQEGFDAPDIAGKRILVRGVLTRGGGGLMLPSIPEEIEWVKDQP
jgi:endonuclease YncB( thermonuclease family)